MDRSQEQQMETGFCPGGQCLLNQVYFPGMQIRGGDGKVGNIVGGSDEDGN